MRNIRNRCPPQDKSFIWCNLIILKGQTCLTGNGEVSHHGEGGGWMVGFQSIVHFQEIQAKLVLFPWPVRIYNAFNNEIIWIMICFTALDSNLYYYFVVYWVQSLGPNCLFIITTITLTGGWDQRYSACRVFLRQFTSLEHAFADTVSYCMVLEPLFIFQYKFQCLIYCSKGLRKLC